MKRKSIIWTVLLLCMALRLWAAPFGNALNPIANGFLTTGLNGNGQQIYNAVFTNDSWAGNGAGLFDLNALTGYNVLNYGADPTGVKPSDMAFSNAWVAISNDGGGVLYVPEGTYNCYEPWVLPYITYAGPYYEQVPILVKGDFGDSRPATSIANGWPGTRINFWLTNSADTWETNGYCISCFGDGPVGFEDICFGNLTNSVPIIGFWRTKPEVHRCLLQFSTNQLNGVAIQLGGMGLAQAESLSTNQAFAGYGGHIWDCTFSDAHILTGTYGGNFINISGNTWVAGSGLAAIHVTGGTNAQLNGTVSMQIYGNTIEGGNYTYGISMDHCQGCSDGFNAMQDNDLSGVTTNLAFLHLGNTTQQNWEFFDSFPAFGYTPGTNIVNDTGTNGNNYWINAQSVRLPGVTNTSWAVNGNVTVASNLYAAQLNTSSSGNGVLALTNSTIESDNAHGIVLSPGTGISYSDNFVPNVPSTYTLGTPQNPWAAIYANSISGSQTTLYVSPTGSTANSGATSNAPTTATWAMTNLSPGMVVVFEPGYYGQLVYTNVNPPPNAPITLISQVQYGAGITQPTANGASTTAAFSVNGAANPVPSGVVLVGFTVTNSMGDGVDVGANCSVLGCAVYNNQWQALNFSSQYARSNLADGNICFSNGAAQTSGSLSPSHYHGIYLSGFNNIVRRNIFAYNTNGEGIDIYSAYASVNQINNDVYDNLSVGNGYYAMTAWQTNDNATPGQVGTNTVRNNTLLGGVWVTGGTLNFSNNIVTSNTVSGSDLYFFTPTVTTNFAGYNSMDDAWAAPAGGGVVGGHSITNANAATVLSHFVNTNNGLFWLIAGAPEIATASLASAPAIDFFGNPQLAAPSIGAFNYLPALAYDIRTFFPAGVTPTNIPPFFNPLPGVQASQIVGDYMQNGNPASSNMFIGFGAGSAANSGTNNVAIGPYAMNALTSGGSNVAVGNLALNALTSGNYNMAFGNGANQKTTTANDNTAIGIFANLQNVTGADNTAIGFDALNVNTSSDNTSIGSSSLAKETTGGYNTGIGYSTMFQLTTGTQNTAIGYQALSTSQLANTNVAVGSQALRYGTNDQGVTAIGAFAFQNGSNLLNSIAIGQNAGYNCTSNTNDIYIGHPGVTQENNVTRIGTQGVQTIAYIAGNIAMTNIPSVATPPIAVSGWGIMWNSNGALYWVTTTHTNYISGP